MEEDWAGNSKSIFSTLGASNHSSSDREVNDYYATDPRAAEMLCDLEKLSSHIWECACGEGHLAKVFVENGHFVKATDLIDRGYGKSGIDFLKCTESFDGDIITNPPYKYASEFVEKAIEIVPKGRKVCMFLKIQFLEGISRKKLFEKYPPKRIWVSSSRIKCAPNGDFDAIKSSAVAYAWFVWQKGYSGKSEIKWFN